MVVFDDQSSRNLYLSIATYDSISPSTALWFLKSAFEEILIPSTRGTEGQFMLRWQLADDEHIKVSSAENWAWESISGESPLLWIALSGWKEMNRAADKNPSIAGITIHFSQHPAMASTLEFSVSMEILGGNVDRATQAAVVKLAISTFRRVSGVVGYITVDYVSANVYGSMAPYERAIGLSYQQASREFSHKVRGYYWGNLLHKSHVELLGGGDVLSKVPAYSVVLVDADRYYLQLTDDINNIDRVKLASLKELFAPILPDGFPQSPEYYQSLPDFLL